MNELKDFSFSEALFSHSLVLFGASGMLECCEGPPPRRGKESWVSFDRNFDVVESLVPTM